MQFRHRKSILLCLRREVLVSEGVLCTAAAAAAAAAAAVGSDSAPSGSRPTASISRPSQRTSSLTAAVRLPHQTVSAAQQPAPLDAMYADGATLAVSGKAQSVLLSGSMCTPPLRPLGAIQLGPLTQASRIPSAQTRSRSGHVRPILSRAQGRCGMAGKRVPAVWRPLAAPRYLPVPGWTRDPAMPQSATCYFAGWRRWAAEVFRGFELEASHAVCSAVWSVQTSLCAAPAPAVACSTLCQSAVAMWECNALTGRHRDPGAAVTGERGTTAASQAADAATAVGAAACLLSGAHLHPLHAE